MLDLTARHFTAGDFRNRAARINQQEILNGIEDGDHRLNPDLHDAITQNGLRDAAVLVPVVDRGAEASVILTKRTDTLRAHAGQIAFPGGRLDPTDPTPEFAALRETQEEIGLASGFIEVVGRMPDYITGSGFRVAPILSVVKPGFRLSVNPDEVDDAFEVPLAFLMNPANHNRETHIWQEKERFFYTMPFQDRYIWGVTAGIIRSVYERLYA